MKQTYDNYFREYFKSEAGRTAHREAQRRYRKRLSKKWGCAHRVAAALERESKEKK